MTVQQRGVGDVTIIDIDGRITIQDGADILRGVVRQLFALSRVKLVFNLEHVLYIDSTALGEIIRVHTSAIRRGGGLKLLHVTPKVRELLTITHLDAVLGRFDDEATALSSFTHS